MRLLYEHCHEGVWFSRNGNRAYLKGERPRFMFPDDANVEPTVKHHIARKISDRQGYSREYVMFYRDPISSLSREPALKISATKERPLCTLDMNGSKCCSHVRSGVHTDPIRCGDPLGSCKHQSMEQKP